MRVHWIGPIVLVVLGSAVACGRDDRSAGSAALLAEVTPTAQLASTGPSAASPSSAARRIRSARLSVEVEDLADAEHRVTADSQALGGYVQDSESSGRANGAEGRQASFVVRVPADRFDEGVAAVQALGKVLESSTQTEDVSEAYADLEMRLRVKHGVEARLRDILERRAGQLSEVLEVERELARVVEEVERIENALAGYDVKIAWSTLHLRLSERESVVDAGFPAKVREAFRGGVAAFTAVASGVVYVLAFLFPWLLLLATALGLMLRYRRVKGTVP